MKTFSSVSQVPSRQNSRFLALENPPSEPANLFSCSPRLTSVSLHAYCAVAEGAPRPPATSSFLYKKWPKSMRVAKKHRGGKQRSKSALRNSKRSRVWAKERDLVVAVVAPGLNI